MLKIINLISFILALQLSPAQAQTFEPQDQKAVVENLQYLKSSFKRVPPNQLRKIAKYLAFIKLTPRMKNYKMDVSRLLGSSLQFILCDNLEDTSCLEATPLFVLNSDMRQDTEKYLGLPIKAGKKLEIEYYFTQGWFDNYTKRQKPFIIPQKTLAMHLAHEIENNDVHSIWLAMYGIDDIHGSMSPVFNAIADKVNQNISVQAVVDVNDSPAANSMIRDYDLVRKENSYDIVNINGALDFSYINPDNRANWVFGSPPWAQDFLKNAAAATFSFKSNQAKEFVATKLLHIDEKFIGNSKAALDDSVWMAANKNFTASQEELVRIAFQYSGTMDFMRMLNVKKQANQEAMTHIEFPFTGIMHNKFVVLENLNKQKSVWTGTANISQTCMGREENANVSIFIKNDFIANAFLTEFKEMFTPTDDKNRPESLVTGLFHTKKRPNTKRNFIFDDGTQVRVHFSPTDDAEHKVILPLLYSAKNGDQLRISMFGTGGFELVRAIQAAVARGVVIKLALDSLNSAGSGSWIKSPHGNLFDPNPFSKKPTGSIEVRLSDWSGLNHHKSATLTRYGSDGTYRPETLIVGSQNWSASGNDLNDENVVTITNKKSALEIMLAFNQEFDEKIWVASKAIAPGTAAAALGHNLEEAPPDAQ